MGKAARDSKKDILRIIAAVSVVLLHVSSDYIDISDVGSFDFNAAVLLNSLTRFAVPVFVMISGELFLDPEKSINVKKIWTHNILRLFIIYLVWSYGYYVFQSLYFWKFPFYKQGIVRTVTGIVYATNHLWFIWMIIGIYSITPVLKTWLKSADEKNIRYFIDIFFIFQIIRTTLTILLNKSLVNEISELLTFTEISGYIGYYVLGYYLSRYKLNKKLKTAIFVILPFGLVFNFLISVVYSKMQGAYTPGIYDSFGVFTFFNCVALYLIAEKIGKKIGSSPKLLAGLSADTLGIYLSHIMLWEVIKGQLGMDFIPISFAAIIVFTTVISAAAALIAALLRRIPFVGRYLV
ncbi:MAG: acyltransferase family protein [Lachnospiraceae bacterium]|nr:acyltransferase family protein [Lachnospiraceae bacterium]